jgi:hypothetical protein
MIKTKYWFSVMAVSVVLLTGSLVISPIAVADDDDDDDDRKKPKTLEQDCAKKKGFSKLLCDAILSKGPSGSEMPISIGSKIFSSNPISCTDPAKFVFDLNGGIVLLSDGTVKVPSPTGGFTTPGAEFGSLPAGVWHDIEGDYSHSGFPDGCFHPTILGTTFERLKACAVAGNGDVYCVDGQSRDDVLVGTPWTFQGNALS